MNQPISGGCLCGAVRYEVTGSLRAIIACHCVQCRRTSGHFVAATACRKAHFRLVQQEGLRWYSAEAFARCAAPVSFLKKRLAKECRSRQARWTRRKVSPSRRTFSLPRQVTITPLTRRFPPPHSVSTTSPCPIDAPFTHTATSPNAQTATRIPPHQPPAPPGSPQPGT
jgi:hypothetical protein